ncbi:hypothetical protein [Cellulomonas sp. PhB143]|uniref:hypothetical protein n=1 Tax=Cellulomonas sp. PhB143 TaxID=2485186 RepID=UPI000F4AC2C7|nr:hypothetical protein [Cellulomonas sp. PhB143]ROS77146.1 hypothetical protein EDF32_1142 [Cellulomonas sp. PhB143]
MTPVEPAPTEHAPVHLAAHAPEAAQAPDHVPPPHTPYRRVVASGLAIAAAVCLVVLAFSWPSVTSEPKDVPVAVTGPAQAVDALDQAVQQQMPGVIDLLRVDDRAAAVDAIETRDAYGAVVLGKTPEVLTASAAGSAVEQVVTGLATQLQEQQPATTVTDVVPLSPDDPHGTGLTAALFPLVLGGMLGGIGISILVVGAGRRILAVGVYAVVGGLALTAILQAWFGSIQGDWWANAAAIALALAAIASPITGAVALLGTAGIGVGAVLMMLVANPLSGATVPPEFLPWHWGAIGQWFPPGAGATLLRDESYFPSAPAGLAWLALGLWTAAGVLGSLVGHFRTAGGTEPDAEAALDN